MAPAPANLHHTTYMHERDIEPGHIPPPDLPRHRRILGFRPHVFLGGLFLIALLLIYAILYVRRIWI